MANKRNIPLKKFKKFLEKDMKCKHIRTEGGHYIMAHTDLGCPSLQSHADPVPFFIVENARRWLGYASPKHKKEWISIIKKLSFIPIFICLF